MKTYYLSTKPECYGNFMSAALAYAEAEVIADAIEAKFPDISTTLITDSNAHNNLKDKEIKKVYNWLKRNWVEILNDVGILV